MPDLWKNNTERIISLDVFRGLTIAAMILVNNPGSWRHIYGPLRHAEWQGWTLADTVFPFFLFIVGVSIALSFGRRLEAEERNRSLYIKAVRRALILFALGLFLNAVPEFDLSTLRIPGVLQRIAVCYLAASIVFLNTRWKGQLTWVLGLLLVYWAAMEWIPVPGSAAGLYEKGNNLANWLDARLLAGHMWSATKTWDPEGILSTVPAISTVLSGVLAGSWLRSGAAPMEKMRGLLAAGVAAVAAGSLWSLVMPINKSLWTSSYCVLMAGLALICLGCLYYIVDVRGWKRWTRPALVFGRNAIAVYVLAGVTARLLYLIKVPGAGGTAITLKSWVYWNLFTSWLEGPEASLGFAILFIAAMYLCMLPLYRHRVLIRI